MRKILLLLVLVILSGNVPFIALGQKLPRIQQTGKRAPVDIKIDGKATEWNDEFQAYNSSCRIYYTMSNDDENLYLTVGTSDGYSNEKAIFGITLRIKLLAEKGNRSKEYIAVAFPPLSENRKVEPIRLILHSISLLRVDSTNLAKKKIDSLRLLANKRMHDTFKEINITGIKEIQEPSISIYNTEGIKVAAQFNDHMQYTYELAIPLKYLGPAINKGQKFNYNIKMNGLPEKTPDSPYPPPTLSIEALGQDNAYVGYSTDFSGVYTLVRNN